MDEAPGEADYVVVNLLDLRILGQSNEHVTTHKMHKIKGLLLTT